MENLDSRQVFVKRLASGNRKSCSAVFFSFTVSHENLTVVEIDVLDPEAETLHEPESSSVKEAGHQPLRAFQLQENCAHFVPAKYKGQSFRLLSAFNFVDPIEGVVQHLAVQKKDGAQRLILRGG